MQQKKIFFGWKRKQHEYSGIFVKDNHTKFHIAGLERHCNVREKFYNKLLEEYFDF